MNESFSIGRFKKVIRIFCLLLPFFSLSCKKFLDEKPHQADVLPNSLADLQSLLDNTSFLNESSAGAFSEVISDNYYVPDAVWQQNASLVNNIVSPAEAQNYIWNDPGLPLTIYWYYPYQGPIYYSNIVLDQLPKINKKAGEDALYNSLKGSALFYRAFALHSLAQLFCKPYSLANADDLGIPLRTTSDISEPITRATVKQTYDRIIADLKEALSLLPSTTAYPTRPSKTSANAALARVYLSMGDYANTWVYANAVLQQYSVLLDYNSINAATNPPIVVFNPEVIFHSQSAIWNFLYVSNQKIDTSLYQSYNPNDLRKVVFFRQNSDGSHWFQGGYGNFGGASNAHTKIFDGLTTDELYLTRAECSARAGNKDSAIADLNRLLVKRWKNTVIYVPVTASDANDALAKVLIERRKELVFRGLRWMDIRRLNVEGANITLKRIIAGNTYTLPPNDKRSVMLIPYEEISRSGIQQNPR